MNDQPTDHAPAATTPEIVARSLTDARRDIPRLDDSAGVVSIGSPGTPKPPGFESDTPRHLRLQFDDVVNESTGIRGRRTQPPSPEHIRRLIDRAELLLDCPKIYCHCAAGVSRSTAAAFILRCIDRPPGDEPDAMRAVLEDNPFAMPNRLMVKHADTILERDGRLLAALEQVSRAF